MTSEETFMGEAVAAAREGAARGDGGPFGAVVVRDGKIISRAWNRVLLDRDPTAHAEVNAIRDAARALGSFRLESCDLYTSCEPCPMCLGAVYWSGVRRVYYAATREDADAIGFSDARLYREFGLAPEARSVPFVRTASVEAQEVMRTWLKDARHRLY